MCSDFAFSLPFWYNSLMQKKPSKGVITFAVLIIVFGILSLLTYLNFKEILKAYAPPLNAIVLFLGLGLTIAELIFAVGILQLKEWARTDLIITVVLAILFTWGSTFTVKKEYTEENVTSVLSSMDSKETPKESFDKGFKFALSLKGLDEKDLTPEQRAKIESTSKQYLERYSKMRPAIITGTILFVNALLTLLNFAIIFFFTRPKVKEQFK